MKRSLFVATLLTVLLHADEPSLLESLTNDISQTTQLATQSNQNIDYQPFILSVWEQKELLAFGATNLKDALMFIPSVDLMGDNINNRTMIVRGSNPLAYGQTKMVIDGITVNDLAFDSYNAYLNFPIELIKRIEVVRGPGSFIDGVNGYAGTINVITQAHDSMKNQENGAVFVGIGDQDSRQVGFWQRFNLDGVQLSIDGFHYFDDMKSPLSVTDKYGHTDIAPLNTEQYNLGFSFLGVNGYFIGRVNDYTYGSAFGNFYALPNDEGKQFAPSWYIEGEYAAPIATDTLLKVKAGIHENSWESNARSLHSGTYGAITYPIGYWGDLKLDNRQIYSNLSLNYSGFENHKIVAGYTFKHEEVTDIQSVTTERVNGGTDMVDYSQIAPFLDAESAHRHTHEFYLEDTINLDDKLALAFNIGGTKASSLSYQQYKRAALVYQPHRNHILKMMVGNSYRLPSWQELYTQNNPARIGNPNLEPERVTSYEGQYIYKPSTSVFLGINAFYLENKEQITTNDTYMYDNIGERIIKGFETEFRGNYREDDTFAFSYSYITGETIKGNQQTDYLPFASSHLIKGAFSYSLAPEIKAAITGRYASEKKRRPDDARPSTESFSTIDVTLGWEGADGIYVQSTLKNLFDTLYRYPSTANTYPDDYPVEGRAFWIRAGWKF